MVTLNHRVTIQQLAAGYDGLGQPVESWTDVASVWANVRHVSGLETIKSDADVSVLKVSVRIRQRAGLDVGMRLVHGADVFDVRALLPDGQNQYLDLVCQKVA